MPDDDAGKSINSVGTSARLAVRRWNGLLDKLEPRAARLHPWSLGTFLAMFAVSMIRMAPVAVAAVVGGRLLAVLF